MKELKKFSQSITLLKTFESLASQFELRFNSSSIFLIFPIKFSVFKMHTELYVLN